MEKPYRSRNVNINARKRKPLKLQTNMIASMVALDEEFVRKVDDVYERRVDVIVVVAVVVKTDSM
jgi:hypothetical protein